MSTITLEGYLGNDRDLRETQERTYTTTHPATHLEYHRGGVMQYDEVLEEVGEYEVTVPSRQYAVLSVAEHSWENGQRKTTWHRVIVWNVDRHEHFAVRLARRGDKVRITGRQTTFVARKGKNKGQTIVQIELIKLEILQTKAPQIP